MSSSDMGKDRMGENTEKGANEDEEERSNT